MRVHQRAELVDELLQRLRNTAVTELATQLRTTEQLRHLPHQAVMQLGHR